MGSCAAPSAKGDDKFITTDYLQQCPPVSFQQVLIKFSVPYMRHEKVWHQCDQFYHPPQSLQWPHSWGPKGCCLPFCNG
ncbi:hypothetical protein C6A40_24615 [Enterobacter sp. GER_MD16_1505_Eko_090]|nr:hypothetical protein C6A40_24615 [Enterobacter sp. GER_MD16_1505_Eko_090]